MIPKVTQALLVAVLVLTACRDPEEVLAPAHGQTDPVEYPDVAGVYDLNAVITAYDPAWGDPGDRQTAVLTIEHSTEAPQFTGTFADFKYVGPGNETFPVDPGSVSGSVNLDGRVVIELFNSEWHTWYGEGMLTSGHITGTWGCCGHISGTFTADRRQAE